MTTAHLTRWERTAEWPLSALAVLFLAGYATPILVPDLSDTASTWCRAITWIAWTAFAVDYLVRLALAPSCPHFIGSNLPDLAVLALPLLRPLRMLRLLTLLTVVNRYAGATLRGRVAVYVAGSSVLLIFVSSLAVLDAERNAPHATIKTFGDAVWWAFTTVTTVGYGDRFPTTGTGRVVAIGLMLGGIALLGVITASLASWLVQRVAEVEEESQAATRADLLALGAQISALQEQLAVLRESPRAR